MAVSNVLTVPLLSLIICIQGLEQRPSLGSRSKRDTLASSMFSAFTNLEKRMAAVEATAQCDNSTEERLVQLEAEVTKLQEKMSALDKHLEDINLSVASHHNASVLAMQHVLQSVTELVAALDQSFKSSMQNVMKILASMISTSEMHLLAKAENNAAVLNASIARVQQMTKELVTRMSAVEDKLKKMLRYTKEKRRRTPVMLEDIKDTTREMSAPLWYRKTCQDYYDDGRTSGVYMLQLENGKSPMEVYSEMNHGAGWVVFQRRQDGSVDFYRNWTNYENGLRDLNGEFWLGNRNIHRLTSAGLTQLRVDLQAWNGSTTSISYSHFSVGDASSSYKLSVSGYSGTAGDGLVPQSGSKFTTFDWDQDPWTGGNCGQSYKGGWWYTACANANLNGE